MKVNRNEPCSCGSGKKYKNCCVEDSATNDRSKLGFLIIALAIILSFGWFAYDYADEIYLDVLKFDFRKKEYEYEFYKCNNPKCTLEHTRRTLVNQKP